MDGILNINKDQGLSSYSIVSSVKRLTGERKAGHAGTLDPAASGVLPVCLGRATRVSEYLMSYPKTYQAEVEFGKTTDTYDIEGTVTSENDPSEVDIHHIREILADLTGEIQQVPPAYSALKFKGKPYYQLARSGQEINIQSRPVTIYSIEVTNWQSPVLTIDVTCGKGTYIRSLAHDLGQAAGCGAYMKSLIRQKYGMFSIDTAISIRELELLVKNGCLSEHLYPVDHVLKHLKALTVDAGIFEVISNGHSFSDESVVAENNPEISLPGKEPYEALRRVYSPSGHFIGLFRYNEESQEWKPEKIFCG
ncbi:MAG: tRNA pseudouridine(55) synthase TruB [Dehalococcoidales bacterium]|nr:tRNA pseudouridine(55) synthase TruB [Dehalococcoidales bacterium]